MPFIELKDDSRFNRKVVFLIDYSVSGKLKERIKKSADETLLPVSPADLIIACKYCGFSNLNLTRTRGRSGFVKVIYQIYHIADIDSGVQIDITQLIGVGSRTAFVKVIDEIDQVAYIDHPILICIPAGKRDLRLLLEGKVVLFGYGNVHRTF